MAFSSSRRSVGVFSSPGFPPGVKWLLIANAAIFIVQFFVRVLQLGTPFSIFELVPVAVVRLFAIWQLVTYAFLHGGFGHIIWNMLALWMFGADLERTWGTRRFINFYFFCAIGAGVCVVVANYLVPWGDPSVPTIGASGAIFGILLAYAMLFPNRTILWGFLIPIQVKWFVLIIGLITFMSSFQVNTGVSEFAHLGGLLCGYIWMRKPRRGFDLIGPVRRQYQQYKLQRAKRKFQVYMRKQGSNRDPWVH